MRSSSFQLLLRLRPLTAGSLGLEGLDEYGGLTDDEEDCWLLRNSSPTNAMTMITPAMMR
jgi:hypothetical protein